MRSAAWLATLLVAGCTTASGPPASVDESTCVRADADGVVSLAATEFIFDATCVVVPAGEAFRIRLDNNDPAEHNVSVYANAGRSEELFHGDLVSGPGRSIDYLLEPLAVGEYWFDCFLHPTRMSGTLLVR